MRFKRMNFNYTLYIILSYNTQVHIIHLKKMYDIQTNIKTCKGSKKMLLIECYLERYIIKLIVIISTYAYGIREHYLVTICGNTDNFKFSIISTYNDSNKCIGV